MPTTAILAARAVERMARRDPDGADAVAAELKRLRHQCASYRIRLRQLEDRCAGRPTT